MKIFRYSPALPRRPAFTPIDGLIVLALAALLYAGARLAPAAPGDQPAQPPAPGAAPAEATPAQVPTPPPANGG